MRMSGVAKPALMRSLYLTGIAALLSACMGAATEPPQPVATPIPAKETPPATVVVEAPPPPSPDRLDGLTPVDVLALLGEPGLVRRDGKVQVMLFEADDCVLELVFVEPSPDDHFHVTHLAARDRKGADIDQTACLTQILPEGTWPD